MCLYFGKPWYSSNLNIIDLNTFVFIEELEDFVVKCGAARGLKFLYQFRTDFAHKMVKHYEVCIFSELLYMKFIFLESYNKIF